MSAVVLLGAGFSRNWGGWLANEAIEYLLGLPDLSSMERDLLWRHRRTGGFESALGELQLRFYQQPTSEHRTELRHFETLVLQMFRDMDLAFSSTQFEFQQHRSRLVATFLNRFDAIFTLNQDLLLERHYLTDNVQLGSNGRWTGWSIPGMKPTTGTFGGNERNVGEWVPSEPFACPTHFQPYVKLHGSSNWIASDGTLILAMGGDKPSIIDRFPILRWSHDLFRERLRQPRTRLMVIGYSFGDHHVNRAILDAVRDAHLEIFVVDPLGIDVLDKNRDAQVYSPHELLVQLFPRIVGASRRSLREIFGHDHAEHTKLMRVLEHGEK